MSIDVLAEFFFFQAEDGIRDLVRSRGLGDVYKRQGIGWRHPTSVTERWTGAFLDQAEVHQFDQSLRRQPHVGWLDIPVQDRRCLLYTSDAADERSSVDLGGRRIIKNKNKKKKKTHKQLCDIQQKMRLIHNHTHAIDNTNNTLL